MDITETTGQKIYFFLTFFVVMLEISSMKKDVFVFNIPVTFIRHVLL